MSRFILHILNLLCLCTDMCAIRYIHCIQCVAGGWMLHGQPSQPARSHSCTLGSCASLSTSNVHTSLYGLYMNGVPQCYSSIGWTARIAYITRHRRHTQSNAKGGRPKTERERKRAWAWKKNITYYPRVGRVDLIVQLESLVSVNSHIHPPHHHHP